MTTDMVLDELERARGAVRRAEHALQTNEDFDLREVERQVDLAAAAATRPDATDRAARRKALVNLVADLNGLHSRLLRERRQTEQALGRVSVSRRAFAAYGDRITT